jgi:hypothetical protein
VIACTVAGCSLAVGDLPEPTAQAGAAGNPIDDSDSGSAAGSTNAAGAGGNNTPDASETQTTADSGVDPCDRDSDGKTSEDCGGADCDDDDDNVFPGQERYFTEPTAKQGFDYDCSGGAEREYPQPLDCTVGPLCDSTKQGFIDPLPLCGQQGEWGQCMEQQLAGGLPLCDEQANEMRRAACH